MTRTFAQSIDNEKKEKQSVLQVAKWFPRDNNRNRLLKVDIQQSKQTCLLKQSAGPCLAAGLGIMRFLTIFGHAFSYQAMHCYLFSGQKKRRNGSPNWPTAEGGP